MDNTKQIIFGQQVVNEEGKLRPAKIIIQGPVIKEVQWYKTIEEFKTDSSKQKHVYLNNYLLSPSFINGHTHCAMSYFRSINPSKWTKKNMIVDLFFQIESHLEERDVEIFTRFGAWENIFNGVGLVWDHYYFPKAAAKAFQETGLLAVVAGTLQDLSGPGVYNFERFIAESLEVQQQNPLCFPALGPHATDTVSLELWEKIIHIAHRTNTPLHFHLAQTHSEYQFIKEKYSMSPFMFLDKIAQINTAPHLLGVHGTYLQEKDLKRIAELKQMTLAQCPISASIFAFPANSLRWDNHKIPYLLATDCVASNDSMNVQKEMRAWSSMHQSSINQTKAYRDFFLGEDDKSNSVEKIKKQKWLQYKTKASAQNLLKKVWNIPGHMHPDFKVGYIRENEYANINIWDLNDPSFWPSKNLQTLVFGDTSNALHSMMIAGNWILTPHFGIREIKKSDFYKDSLVEGKARLKSLFKRAKIQL